MYIEALKRSSFLPAVPQGWRRGALVSLHGLDSISAAATRALWRELLVEEQSDRCARCSRRLTAPESVAHAAYLRLQPTFQHITPPSLGGSHALENLRLIHRWCEVVARGRARRVRANAQGERWCRSRRWKRVYASLAAAWLATSRMGRFSKH